MLKKHAIVALLLFAYTIVFAHSVVPHHHHEDDDNHALTGGIHHHDDNDHANEGLAHFFESYMHSTNGADLHQQPHQKISISFPLSACIVNLFSFELTSYEATSPQLRHGGDHIPILRHSLSPKGLRAPPCTLA